MNIYEITLDDPSGAALAAIHEQSNLQASWAVVRLAADHARDTDLTPQTAEPMPVWIRVKGAEVWEAFIATPKLEWNAEPVPVPIDEPPVQPEQQEPADG